MKIHPWIHNDITWCANSAECENTKCFRHTSNQIKEKGRNIYSIAFFKGSVDCPLETETYTKR